MNDDTANTEQASSSSQSNSRRPREPYYSWREGNGRPLNANRQKLARTAAETRAILPDILRQLPSIHASRSEKLHLDTFPPLRAADCPKYHGGTSGAKIHISDGDSWNVAIELMNLYQGNPAGNGRDMADRVAVLNMASHKHPGGGWIRGAMAQEEALCYRSSLSLSLPRHYYPWRHLTGVYTPDVVVIRGDHANGHVLLLDDPNVQPADLPVFSVLSVAAINRPATRMGVPPPAGAGQPNRRRQLLFADTETRDLTKSKMRMTLRMAGARGHSLLVLGALGCGAFCNPPEEVATCWLEVLQEPEFAGGWWREVWFAVFDTRREGNYEIFDDVLGGVMV